MTMLKAEQSANYNLYKKLYCNYKVTCRQNCHFISLVIKHFFESKLHGQTKLLKTVFRGSQ